MIDHPVAKIINTLPTLPGCYIFKDVSGNVLYVGKAKNIRARVSSYFHNYSKLTARIQLMVDSAENIETYVVDTEVEALILEASLIKKYKPKYNVLLKDGKNYTWIKITNDPYPIVYRTRQINDPNATYFGPFMNSQIRDKLYSWLRKQFPFRSCNYKITDEELAEIRKKREKGQNIRSRLCIYYHLNLCGGPCEGLISQSEYLANIESIKKFLTNKRNILIEELKEKMYAYSTEMEFEKAAKIKEQIEQLQNVSSELSIAYGDDEDDVLRLYYQRTMKGLEFLIRDLKINGYEIFEDESNSQETKKLRSDFLDNFRMECFDISNISGTNPVGSMVVFQGGMPLKSDYRKFKIKTKETPDDFAMMREMLRRRFFYLYYLSMNKNESILNDKIFKDLDDKDLSDSSFSKKPNLVIIDGGKGQLGVAVDVIHKEYGLKDIFVCSLAKKREEVFVPGISYSKLYYDNKEALFLLQRIRDETHRFGITYHRLRRSKAMLED